MRKFLLILFLVVVCPLTVFAQEEKPVSLEQLILQQHFTQKELERTLTLIKQEETRAQRDLAQLELDLKRQKLVIEAMHRHAGEVARAYYTGERANLLTLLFNADNFNEFLLMFDFIQLLYDHDMQRLEMYQTERAKLVTMQEDEHNRLEQLRDLRKKYEAQLAEMLAIQAEKEKNVQKLDDPAEVEALMDNLIDDWQKRGLPAFQTFFGLLADVMVQVPELVTPERIQSDGLFSHTLTIKQNEFNQFLMSKDELFKQSHFSFEDNKLIVEGTYDHIQLRLVGTYELVSPTALKFHINELYYDGFALPPSTIADMEKMYDLGFYPGLISPNIQVEGITMMNEELKLHLRFNLPFGFGKK
ncbi:coiled-coil domain-containing protein [Brevibacillus sp. GCM10020057]|uniref:coiled-coil domain-containing protein n=1 Tax=Brevibacillus sp. GCM10020057 TaxID=3317327 RepID=UPI00362CFE1D